MRFALPLGLALAVVSSAPALAAVGDQMPLKHVEWSFE